MEKPQLATDKVHEASYNFERPVVFDDGEGKTSTDFIVLKDRYILLSTKRYYKLRMP
ncbi:hypothetical protein [Pontibacter cellulosilyticus]|uniref:Uncharacterized protein n=1 Tax=Pontibacter cellulosilyticus TaxID=1720253 RepID=A0A923SI61_9BACT|nr:hypothetical protein [Pontibacter cellulosilyticus]MBC5992272.1 hypothetical protein [Pontibacter cellulosilyticus]